MSAPKFLTWSKGQSYSSKEDRKHASSGIVPIPIECISFKGMDYGRSEKRSSKLKRRPIPLEFEKPELNNNNSFALHDAAIKSATTLMAVMNDVLKSPHLNAHFHSQQTGGLQPMHNRPRSRTAPPTPMFEAPGVEPVELPGSFPVWSKSEYETRYSMDAAVPPTRKSMGRAIERPHSSPQPSTYAFPDDIRQPTLATSRSASNVRLAAGQVQHERHRSESRNRQSISSGQASLASEVAFSTTGKTIARGSPYGQFSTPRTEDPPSSERRNANHLSPVPPTSKSSIQDETSQRMDTKALLEQISAMRRSHDAHISSLKEAHDREVESHKSYITFLESCPATVPEPHELSKNVLTLDTSHIASKASGPLSLDVSASTSLQSLDSSLESQRRASVESATAEAEALKRKLSLCRKTQSELGDVRRERDHFREHNDRSERRIGQLKDIVRKGKDNEKALKNKICGLEDALLAANTQRVDVLEGYHEACEQISGLHEKLLAVIKERDEVTVRLAAGKTDTTSDGSSPQDVAFSQQLDELRRLVSEKDSKIQLLETERKNSVPRLEVCKLEKQLADAEAVRDQYNNLLHAELRRQSKNVALNLHAATPEIENGALATVTEKLKSKPGSENAEKRCEFLEKELKHCFSEIILYKLDIRGYRKDLKEANSKIEVLQLSRPHRPGTPDSMDHPTADDKSLSPGRRRRATSGLGISLQRPATPTRPSTTSLATPKRRDCATASPAPSTKTPLELHKKLPKPPTVSRDPSPSAPTTTTLNRAETLRSLSESIISSYAKRATPELDYGDVLPLFRGRSSDPAARGGAESWRAIDDAVAVPIQRYTADMVKTPVVGSSGVGKA